MEIRENKDIAFKRCDSFWKNSKKTTHCLKYFTRREGNYEMLALFVGGILESFSLPKSSGLDKWDNESIGRYQIYEFIT